MFALACSYSMLSSLYVELFVINNDSNNSLDANAK